MDIDDVANTNSEDAKSNVEESDKEKGKRKIFVGSQALNFCRDQTERLSPIKDGIVADWDMVDNVWDHAFRNCLMVDPKEPPMLLAEPPMNTPQQRGNSGLLSKCLKNTKCLHCLWPRILYLPSTLFHHFVLFTMDSNYYNSFPDDLLSALDMHGFSHRLLQGVLLLWLLTVEISGNPCTPLQIPARGLSPKIHYCTNNYTLPVWQKNARAMRKAIILSKRVTRHNTDVPATQMLPNTQKQRKLTTASTSKTKSNQLLQCTFCTALVWPAESTGRDRSTGALTFAICCNHGQIKLPPVKQPPPFLEELLCCSWFRDLIRVYNSALSFTSLGAKLDKSGVYGARPFMLRIQSQTYHCIGSLLPCPENCQNPCNYTFLTQKMKPPTVSK